MHHSKIAATVMFCLVAAGCQSAADQQNRMNVAQAEADEKISVARAEGEAKGRVAQSHADVKIAEAQANFAQIREDYRHTVAGKLLLVDQKVMGLEAKEPTLTGRSRTDLGASLENIRSARAQFMTDYALLDHETASTWDAAKSRLDTQFAQLEDMVDGA